MGSFERAGNRSMPKAGCERGSRQSGISIASGNKFDDPSEGGSRFTYEAIREEQTWEQGGAGESGFDPVELWVMGPPCQLKVGRVLASCTVMIARHVRG